PPDAEVLDQASRVRGMIVISGNMYHPPNVDGILFFLREVFPLVLSRYPEAVLYIVGALPDYRLVNAAHSFGQNVVITGKGPEVSSYLRKAIVAVCPVRLAIGVQTKILEA